MAQKEKIYPTRDNKLKVSKAWYYEWMMLNGCLIKIKDYENKDKVIYNALIEAFCVHLRNFIEFFCRKKRRPCWTDFLPRGKRISLKYKLDKYERKVNDLLSHCTYKRLNYTGIEKEWDIRQIANEVNKNMFQFVDAADKSLLCDDISAYQKQLRSGNRTQDSSLLCTTSDAISHGTILSACRRPPAFRRTKKK